MRSATAFNGNPTLISPNGNGIRFNFAAEPSQQSRIDDAFSALAYGGMITKAPPPRPQPREWLAWADVRVTGFDRSNLGADLKGDQVNATAGLTRKLTPDVLVGLLAGYETFDYTSQSLTGRLKGDGWTVGAYLGWRFAPRLRFDAAVARSGLNYDGIAGTAVGTFTGSRWLVSGGVTGTYDWRSIVFGTFGAHIRAVGARGRLHRQPWHTPG